MLHALLVLPFALAPLGAGSDTEPALRLPALVSDGMVLQRDSRARVWGWCPDATRVTVTASWDGRAIEVAPDADGRFEAELRTPAAGGPYEIAFVGSGSASVGAPSDGASATVRDVWSGEVWLASGQSNMEWSVGAARWSRYDDAKYAEALASANEPRIRFFQVANEIALAPKDDCRGSWTVCTPDTVPGFSAVAFHFANRLVHELDVPIGVVQSDWGGTVCEAWTSAPALRRLGDFDDALDRIEAEAAAPGGVERSLAERQGAWWTSLFERDPGARERWFATEYDDSGWEAAQVPGDPDGGFDGDLWFRRTFEVPEALAGVALVLELGPVDDMDVVWVDGIEVGSTRVWNRWDEPRSYRLPLEVATAGVHELCVLCVDTGGGAGMHGDARSMRVRAVDGPVESVELAGEWKWRRGLSLGELGDFPRNGWFHQNSPTALYDAMIAPLGPYRFRGAIWYQGESNADRPEQYARLFPAMIEDWRRLFRGERGSRGFDPTPFPFYFVQLAPWARPGDDGQWSRLRIAQERVMEGNGGAELAHTGMAVITDVGNPNDIHPRRKLEVGERLANWALARTYAPMLPATDVRKLRFEKAPHKSPELRSVLRGKATRAELGLEGDGPDVACLSLEFDDARAGFTTSDGGPATTFEVAGADGIYREARAVLLVGKEGAEKDTILVGTPEVEAPVAVRFCWRAGDEPNLRTDTGLPLGPFEGRLSKE
ncbi:MAG: sialate O-acetylesterase [Planctomycetota bacterium]